MNRGGGSTNWILYSAVVNPNCVIVSKDETTSRYLANKFQSLVVENDTFKQFHEMNGGVEPSFYSLDQFFRMRGYGRKPVIFDNSSFF